MKRRECLKICAALLALAPLRALAALWNHLAFEANDMNGALQGLGITRVEPSPDIVLVAPDFAEDGRIVQIEVSSRIPGTEAIAILAEKNPTSLLANFMFTHGAEPYVLIRVKLAESGEVRAVVKAAGRYYSASKYVEVAIGGCG
jgi:sulfur-oxidizing protein SoxY